MQPITNYNIYTERMQKTINDKLYFLDHLKKDITTVVDFGCADGTLGLDIVNYEYVGYDIDAIMIEKAKVNNPKGLYFYDFDEMMTYINPNECVLVLSSVIHEVYSYGKEYQIEQFWNRVLHSGFKQIAIRDMALKNNLIAYGVIDPENALKLTNKIYELNKDYIPMVYYKDYAQLLLKYWYIENWKRESKEDYFPLTVSEVLHIVSNTDYEQDFLSEFTIPFVTNKIKTDLGIRLNHTTHYKMILTHK